jgi:hypothetical protein
VRRGSSAGNRRFDDREDSSLEQVGEQFSVAIFVGWARMHSGWAQAMTGDAPGGIERLSDGVRFT